MKLGNIFNKKKEEKEIKGEEKKEEIKKAVPQPVPDIAPKGKKEKTLIQERSLLISPHISEKATDLVRQNQYVFNVASNANAVNIKRAVENVYGVDVLKVNIVNVPRKSRRVGRYKGWRKGYKKAIVKIKKGQTIEVLPR
ncbi:MAG: 50S ribosomal protein L23 [Parcubacteria group bacterium GW2011_GWC1_38_6]|nr:MAG: 50S ribosomal protein L23 [Parcubacteria group bacterium GW2011_GWA1_36_12]KKQ76271.1 MAG: 50S ribosomal protein L23 [Parcubacteria group bacterium GW2011_GWC1_38_6]